MKYFPKLKDNIDTYTSAQDEAFDLIYMFDEEDWIKLEEFMQEVNREGLFTLFNILANGPFEEAKKIIFKYIRHVDKEVSEEAVVTLAATTDIHDIELSCLPKDIVEKVKETESKWEEIADLKERLA